MKGTIPMSITYSHDFHGVAKVTIGRLRIHSDSNPFCVRDITLSDQKGNSLQITLYSRGETEMPVELEDHVVEESVILGL